KKYVPHDIADGEKQGFSGPDGTWFKGESIDYVRRLLYNRNARIYDYLDRTAVQALVDEHLAGIANRRLLIWSLIYLENLMEVFARAFARAARDPATEIGAAPRDSHVNRNRTCDRADRRLPRAHQRWRTSRLNDLSRNHDRRCVLEFADRRHARSGMWNER